MSGSRNEASFASRRGKFRSLDIEEELCTRALQTARLHASRLTLSKEDGEDFAVEFAEMVLLKSRFRSFDLFISTAFLYRCAIHFGQDYQKHRLRHSHREVCQAEMADADGIVPLLEPADNSLLLAVEALRSEIQERIDFALQQLTSEQQELFARHYVLQETAAEIAGDLGRSPHAVRQSLSNICRRMRLLLAFQGLTEMEARAYLIEICMRL